MGGGGGGSGRGGGGEGRGGGGGVYMGWGAWLTPGDGWVAGVGRGRGDGGGEGREEVEGVGEVREVKKGKVLGAGVRLHLPLYSVLDLNCFRLLCPFIHTNGHVLVSLNKPGPVHVDNCIVPLP